MITEEDITSLKIIKWQDNEDGSSDVQFECSDKLRNYLAGQGLIYALTKMVDKYPDVEFIEGAEYHPNVDSTT